jgi:putative endonuclease
VDNAHLSLGKRGEDAALRYLERLGYRLLARNWRCKFGEIDLIMRAGETVVFVEVRVRRSGVENALVSVDERKQHKLRLAMQAYLSTQGWDDVEVRLDVIAVRFDDSGEHGSLTHARDVLTW